MLVSFVCHKHLMKEEKGKRKEFRKQTTITINKNRGTGCEFFFSFTAKVDKT
jgi:hypothetical protein